MRPAVRQLCCAGLLGTVAVPAAAQRPDSTGPGGLPLVARWEAAVAVGAVAVAGLFDGAIRSEAQESRSLASNQVARMGNAGGTFRVVGPLLAAGWLTGAVIKSPAVKEATIRAGLAGAVAGTISAALKVGFGRARPLSGADPGGFAPFTALDASFPSGHTTLAVAIATSLAHSTPDGWSDVAFYGAAALTGFARINDDKHWLSDVVAGSVIGYLVGRQITIGSRRVSPVVRESGIGAAVEF